MSWIKDRIDAEHRKHKSLDWSQIAESKINMQLKEMGYVKIEDVLEVINKRLSRFSNYIKGIPEGNHNFNRNSLSGMSYNCFLLIEKELKDLAQKEKTV